MAVMNMKGGVGKSTVASNFGWYAAYLKNLKVLLVDLDPQFNLSQYILGAEGYEQLIEKGLPTVDAMFQPSQGQPPVQVNKLIRKVKNWEDGSCLHLIPASLDLAWTMRLALERSHVLRDQLDDVRSDYDLIIIDCAPTESILSTATYHAADWILVPVKPEFLATIGMPLLLKSLQEFKRTYPNEDAPEVAGILFNDVSDRVEHTRSRQRVRKEAAELKLHVFKAELNHSDSYPTGARRGQPIFMTDNARTERKNELTRVGNEILERVGL
ncbi:MAG: ParA family protein [Phenylobacterium sp.]|nr:MAG: ParA family protein [Phenylobacterium sp.]